MTVTNSVNLTLLLIGLSELTVFPMLLTLQTVIRKSALLTEPGATHYTPTPAPPTPPHTHTHTALAHVF